MDLPFTAQEFLGLFKAYNEAIWPAQLVAYGLGALAVAVVLQASRHAARIVPGILAAFWLWMGAVYHLAFFSSINPAAYAFGGLFLIQGGLFVAESVRSSGLAFSFQRDAGGVFGGLLIFYAMILYPLAGHLLGHGYPYAPVFGVAPCPATIFTFGLLLWTRGRVPRRLLVIPVLWSLIGFTAALKLGIYEDVGLLAAGIGTVFFLLRRRSEPAPMATH